MQPKFISSAAIAITLGTLVGGANAQTVVVDDNVNQIEGTVSFAPGSALPAGFSTLNVYSNSVGISPASDASTSVAASGSSASYSLTVLSDDVQHHISPYAYTDSNRDAYIFEGQTSSAVPLEPAPAVQLSFSECTGAVRVNFLESASGNAATVPSMSSHSRSEAGGPGVYGNWQAWTSVGATSSEIYPVRGDGLMHQIQVDFRLGLINYTQVFERPVACGETVVIDIPLDEVDTMDLGGITGAIDLRYRNENPNTFVQAYDGPFGNSGYTFVAPGYGDFTILDLLPSTATNPSKDYYLYGSMSFANAYGTVNFRTPNHGVFVAEGQITDVANTFVMNEAQVAGQIELTGPQECMSRISGPGSTIQTHVYGTSTASWAGSAHQNLTGAVSAVDATLNEYRYNSAYELQFGTPNNAPANWRPGFHSSSYDPADTAYAAYYTLYDNDNGAPLLGPGDSANAPFEHCVVPVEAHVNINGTQALGTNFTNPRVWVNGADGVENYSVSGYANGSPANGSAPATSGMVTMCLPAGDYQFDARISAHADNGEISDTRLLPETAPIECGAWVRPFYFTVDVEDVPCPGGDLAELPFEMSAKALLGGGRAKHAYVLVNGGPASGGQSIDICGGSMPACEDSPAFDATFNVDTSALAQCGNSLEVFVVSTTDDVSKSAPQEFNFEAQGPTGWGCDDVDLTLASGASTAALDLYSVSSQLNECGIGQTANTVCVIYDSIGRKTLSTNVVEGTSLNLSAGQYKGQCYVSTGCGRRNCSFDATVTN